MMNQVSAIVSIKTGDGNDRDNFTTNGSGELSIETRNNGPVELQAAFKLAQNRIYNTESLSATEGKDLMEQNKNTIYVDTAQAHLQSDLQAVKLGKKKFLFGGKAPNAVPADIQSLYNKVGKTTDEIGGNSYGGPIYGEITQGSMQKLIQLMIDHTSLSQESQHFIDIGCGLACIEDCHAGCKTWNKLWRKMMLQSVFLCLGRYYSTEVTSLDPFTHVYMFDTGILAKLIDKIETHRPGSKREFSDKLSYDDDDSFSFSYGGPIYGEITQGSMQKLIQLMIDHTSLSQESHFIDIGCGLACIEDCHAGCKTWNKLWRKMMLQSVFLCLGRYYSTEVTSLDPFTHVYMFDTGSPPELLKELVAVRWNRSGSEFLICYHGPKCMVDKYHFSVKLMVQSTAYMTTTSEGRECYIYRCIQGATSDGTHCDKFFHMHRTCVELWTKKQATKKKKPAPKKMKQLAKKNPRTKKEQKWI
ncbi:hypothetical protein ACHAWU_008032 [Discostella pseudostelligera]|uniref:Uncharacterized protein n=1 Tax=Discostella pseudostelligera TaxID=259834 RepID=A0ABD3MTA2_9STRA